MMHTIEMIVIASAMFFSVLIRSGWKPNSGATAFVPYMEDASSSSNSSDAFKFGVILATDP